MDAKTPISVDVMNYSTEDIEFDLREKLNQQGLSVIGKLPEEDFDIALLRFKTDNRMVADAIHDGFVVFEKGKAPVSLFVSNYLSPFGTDVSITDIIVNLKMDADFNMVVKIKARRQIRIVFFQKN